MIADIGARRTPQRLDHLAEGWNMGGASPNPNPPLQSGKETDCIRCCTFSRYRLLQNCLVLNRSSDFLARLRTRIKVRLSIEPEIEAFLRFWPDQRHGFSEVPDEIP